MRFYTTQHPFYCGIDLHARMMYVCILDQRGEVLVHRNMKTDPETFLKTIAPYRQGMVVAVECMFTWYWLADVCAAEGITFVLSHALAMKAIHGGKAKNDRIDSHKIAVLLRGGMLPQAYVYPSAMRSTRDLIRRRLHLVRKRGSWPTSRTRAPNTTCPSSVESSPIAAIATGWRSIFPIRMCRRASRSTSPSSISTTRS